MKSRMSKYTAFILWGVILAYGGLCFYLFYMQSIQPLDYNNRYFQSDLPYHISMIIDDGWYYSFTAYAYQLLYRLGGNGTVLIALFLAAASVLCVFLTERLLELLTGRKKPDALTLGCALALNLVMPFFWPMRLLIRICSLCCSLSFLSKQRSWESFMEFTLAWRLWPVFLRNI